MKREAGVGNGCGAACKRRRKTRKKRVEEASTSRFKSEALSRSVLTYVVIKEAILRNSTWQITDRRSFGLLATIPPLYIIVCRLIIAGNEQGSATWAMKGNGITYRDAFVRSCLNDKRDTTPRATANLYVANFRSDVLDFSTYYLRPTPRVHRSRATQQRRKTAVGRRTTRVHLIYREILRSRHRETIHSGTTVTFQTRTAIVSVSRYRAGDWRWVTLSLVYLHNDEQTNEPTNRPRNEIPILARLRLLATIYVAIRDARRTPPVYNRVHRLYTHPDESTRLLGKRETRNYFKIRSVFRGNFSRNRHRSPRRWISRQEISPTGRIARNRIETSIRSFNVDGRIVWR